MGGVRGAGFVLAGLVSVFCAAQAESPSDCQRYRLASLPLTYDRAGRPQIEATIDGTKLQMMIDTGGIDSELNERTVEKLKLPKTRLETRARVYDAAGVPVLYSTVAGAFRIGAMSGKNWPFLVSGDDAAFTGSDLSGGVLAPDILAKYDIEFDFGADKFAIFTHDDCPGRTVYWSMGDYGSLPFTIDDGYHIVAHASLDGTGIDVLLDTGSSLSVMTDKVAREIGLDPGKMEKPASSPDSGRRLYQAKVLDLNGMNIQNPKFLVIPEKNAAFANLGQHRPTVILGDTALKQLHLYIAYREKVLYFTKADAR
jgi:predicted aspartyl protease